MNHSLMQHADTMTHQDSALEMRAAIKSPTLYIYSELIAQLLAWKNDICLTVYLFIAVKFSSLEHSFILIILGFPLMFS